MKQLKLSGIAFFLLILLSCKKDKIYDSAIIVTVIYNNQPVPNIPIYMKKGTVANMSQYDQSLTSNNHGQVTFTDLKPDSYYFYASSDTPAGTKTGTLVIKAETSTSKSKYSQGNAYSGKIHLN